MSFRVSIVVLLVALFNSLIYHETEGRKIVTRGEELEFEEQLNKTPSVKSIQDELSNIYDCVDIKKQPAFDHPLLKDHNIQMKPTSLPRGFVNLNSSILNSIRMMFKGMGCPSGMVPIRRTQREVLIRANQAAVYKHFALVESKKADVVTKYYGAAAQLNVINPKVGDHESSLALIRISSVTTTENIIQAGWAVSPELFGDQKTHFMTYWKGDHSGCFNLKCSGFVQTNKNYPIDMALETSVYNNPEQQEMQLLIHQEKSTKNWWVSYEDINLGYWPGSLLPGLANGGSVVAFGGETLAPVTGASPLMGFGTFPHKNFQQCGYMAQMQVVDENNELRGLAGTWNENVDCPQGYGVKNYRYEKSNGHNMEYGGPGGYCGN